ncbi:DNA helicase [Tanacetum coccineum]
MLWEWRGIANMDFIQLGGNSRVDEMILARVSSGFADYIGRIQAVGRLITSGDATINRTHRRTIDIQNLRVHTTYNGSKTAFTMWNEMALDFNTLEYESMDKPVIIAFSSCYVTRYNGLQLSGASAHYYLNLNVAETYQIRKMYPQLPNMAPPLDIKNQRDEDLEKERNRNRFPLFVLLEVDP